MPTFRTVSAWTAMLLAAIFVAPWVLAEDQPKKATTAQAEHQQQATAPAGRPNGLSDAQIGAWLILQHHREVEISKWGAEKANSEQVKAFAQVMAAEHGKMIAKLHSAKLVDRKSAEAELGQVLQELAKRAEQRLSDEEGRIQLGFRGDDRREAPTDRRDERSEDREQLRDQRDEVRDTRQDVRQSRRDDDQEDEARRDDVRDQRRELRDERSDSRDGRREITADERRENVRNFMREAMPFVRENLPTILEMVGESVETAAERDSRAGWIDFQRQVAQKHIQSVKQQLEKQSGNDFDEAFMAYQIGAHMQMINTLEVAQNYVSSDMRSTVDQMLASTQKHLNHAQQLMQKVEDPSSSSQQ